MLRYGLKMSGYGAYWLICFLLINSWPGSYYFNKLSNKCKRKLVILQAIGIIEIKSKETRVVTYTYRYSSGHLIPIIIVTLVLYSIDEYQCRY